MVKRLSLLLLLSGCSVAPIQTAVIPTEFCSYIEEFQHQANKHNRQLKQNRLDNLQIFYKETKPQANGDQVVGVCYTSYDPSISVVVFRIEIDPTYWNEESNNWDKELLIAHELGHCLLDKKHNDDMIGSRPASIMNTYLMDGDVFYKYRDYYYEEMFK
jgi:hypothetical protein